MKRRIPLLTTLCATLLAVGVGTAVAGPGGWGHPGPLAAVYQLDDLTPEQRSQIDALRDEGRALMAQSRADRQALSDAMAAGTQADQLRPLAERQGQQVTAMTLHRAKVRASLDQILTAEQRGRLSAMPTGSPQRRGCPRGW